MAKNGEAADAAGRPLLSAEEIDRIEKFYGAVDPSTRQVKIRRITVRLNCGIGGHFDSREREWVYDYGWRKYFHVWVWDWGRTESPTEFQFRDIEREWTACSHNSLLRRTLNDIFEQAKKNKVAFADLVDQKVRTAQGESSEAIVTRATKRSRRHRRYR